LVVPIVESVVPIDPLSSPRDRLSRAIDRLAARRRLENLAYSPVFEPKEKETNMSTLKENRQFIVTLNLPKPVPSLVKYALRVVQAMTGNPSFPSPAPTLAEVTAATTALEAAETATLARTKGSVPTRNEKRLALVTLLRQLKGYIQTVADANPDTAVSVIESAGVAVRKTAVRKPRVFEVKPGPLSGSADLVAAKASQSAAYEWETSADGGKTWVLARATLQAKATVSGLATGTSVQFRYRPITKTGEGDWSQPLSMLVK
jgi:hypothetical protein